jgi:arylformamidase
MLYDISRTISPQTAVWPGDHPFRVEHALDISAGSSINLTTMTLSPHTATHADAYYHYQSGGAHPAQMPLAAYLGPAYVVRTDQRDGPLFPSDFPSLAAIPTIERLLVHSHVSHLPDTDFPREFPYLSVELIAWLADKSTRLIGLDSPSVDHLDSKDLPCHHALQAHQMVNLELICLRDVPDGVYELVALPLKVDSVCGSPVRAVLRPLASSV